MLDKAKAFAEERHRDQMYGGLPYSQHLLDVVNVAREYGLPDYIQVAAWLHDVLEDTNTTFDELMWLFGVKVFDLVNAVTNEKGKNRKERHAKTHPKVRQYPDAVALKLCDRIANVRACLENNSSLLQMYIKEYQEFRDALYRPGEWETLWKELDSLLAFKGDRHG